MQFITADITGLEAIISINEGNYSIYGIPSIPTIMMAIRTLGKMQDTECSDFKLSTKILNDANKVAAKQWVESGHPCSVEAISYTLARFGTQQITCPIVCQVCQTNIMKRWWKLWAPTGSSSPLETENDPYAALGSSAENGDFVAMNNVQFIQKLASTAAEGNPKCSFNDFKNQGWPGYSDFRTTVKRFVKRLLTIGNNDPSVQTDATVLSLVRLFVAEPVWLAAFRQGPPTTLEDLIARVLEVQYDPRYSTESLWEIYGIGTNAGLCETPLPPFRVPFGCSNRLGKETPSNLMAALYPDYEPVNAHNAPLYRLRYKSERKPKLPSNKLPNNKPRGPVGIPAGKVDVKLPNPPQALQALPTRSRNNQQVSPTSRRKRNPTTSGGGITKEKSSGPKAIPIIQKNPQR